MTGSAATVRVRRCRQDPDRGARHRRAGSAGYRPQETPPFARRCRTARSRATRNHGRDRARSRPACCRRFGTRLDDVEPAIPAVLGPFDVHRRRMPGETGVVVLDTDRAIGKFEHLRVGEAEPFALALARLQVAGAGGAAPAPIDEPRFLAAQRPAQDRAIPLPERRFVDVELIGIDVALHDILAEAPRPGDEDDVAEPGFGVEGKDDPAGRQVRSAPFS